MKRCKGITRAGAPCRAQAIDGDYCEWHLLQAPTDRVTEIRIASKELASGQVIRRKPLGPRPRVFKRNRFERDGWGDL